MVCLAGLCVADGAVVRDGVVEACVPLHRGCTCAVEITRRLTLFLKTADRYLNTNNLESLPSGIFDHTTQLEEL